MGTTREQRSGWTWERSLPIVVAPARRPLFRVMLFPALTWWTAGVIALVFAVLLVLA